MAEIPELGSMLLPGSAMELLWADKFVKSVYRFAVSAYAARNVSVSHQQIEGASMGDARVTALPRSESLSACSETQLATAVNVCLKM